MDIEVGYMLPLTLTNGDKAESIPEWYVSDANLAVLKVADDGLSAFVVPRGRSGSVTVTASAYSAGEVVEVTFDVTIYGAVETPITLDIIPGDLVPV